MKFAVIAALLAFTSAGDPPKEGDECIKKEDVCPTELCCGTVEPFDLSTHDDFAKLTDEQKKSNTKTLEGYKGTHKLCIKKASSGVSTKSPDLQNASLTLKCPAAAGDAADTKAADCSALKDDKKTECEKKAKEAAALLK